MAEEKEKAAEPPRRNPRNADEDKGYIGYAPDPTPNHAYTVEGVTKGEPTPETDDKLRRKARENIGL